MRVVLFGGQKPYSLRHQSEQISPITLSELIIKYNFRIAAVSHRITPRDLINYIGTFGSGLVGREAGHIISKTDIASMSLESDVYKRYSRKILLN